MSIRWLEDNTEYKDNKLVKDESFMDTVGPILIGVGILVLLIIWWGAFVWFVKFVVMRKDKIKIPTLQVNQYQLWL